MFKTCIKNYVSCIRYVFAALGVMFLALLIGGQILLTNVREVTNKATEDIRTTTKEADLSTGVIWDSIRDTMIGDMATPTDFEADTNDDKLVSGNEVKDHVATNVDDALSQVMDNYAQYASAIAIIVGDTIGTLALDAMEFLLIQVLGIMATMAVVQFLARSDIEHRNPFHLIGSRIVHALIIIVSVVIVLLALYYLPTLGVILMILYPILYCIISLMSANLSLGKKRRLPMKEVLRPANFFMLFLSNLVVIIISVVIAYGVMCISTMLIAIYILIALISVTAAAVSLNADACVYAMADKRDAEAEGINVLKMTKLDIDEEAGDDGEAALEVSEAPLLTDESNPDSSADPDPSES